MANKDTLSFVKTEFNPSDISWQAGKDLHKWWLKAKGDRKYPEKKDFNPADYKSLLPTLLVLDVTYDGSGAQFTIRLAGTKVCDLIKSPLTGKNITDLKGNEKLLIRFRELLKLGKPILIEKAPMTWTELGYGTYSSFSMPFAEKGKPINKFITCLHTHLS